MIIFLPPKGWLPVPNVLIFVSMKLLLKFDTKKVSSVNKTRGHNDISEIIRRSPLNQ